MDSYDGGKFGSILGRYILATSVHDINKKRHKDDESLETVMKQKQIKLENR